MRPAVAEDWPAICGLIELAFLSTWDAPLRDAQAQVYEPDRGLVMVHGDDAGDVVAHACAYSRDLAVPGGVVRAAHVAMVAVAPTRRRHGLLTRLLTRLLRDAVQNHQEPVAVLWASEPGIYGRFGFAAAATVLDVTVDLRSTRRRLAADVLAPHGSIALRDADPQVALADARRVYEQVWRERPGWSSRSPAWWKRRVADPPAERWGATALRALVADSPGGPMGYAWWRADGRWTAGVPDGDIHLVELAAATPAAAASLCRTLVSMDLASTLSYPLAGVDDPLLALLGEPGAVLPGTVRAGPWIRILDLPRALEGRRFQAPLDVVLDVSDEQYPRNAGRWRLAGDSTGAQCVPTNAEPAVSIDIRNLARLYLGGGGGAAARDAGLIMEHKQGAIAALSGSLGWWRAPSVADAF